MNVIYLYLALKNHVASHRPLAKLLSFKLIVGLAFIQGVRAILTQHHSMAMLTSYQIIFWALRDTNTLEATEHLSFADLNIGIPQLILCVEMVPIAVFYHYAYSHKPYVLGLGSKAADDTGTYVSAGTVWLGLLDPRPLGRMTLLAFRLLVSPKRRQKVDRHDHALDIVDGGEVSPPAYKS
jgi:hypothetical protein